uniref:Coiled-coil domain-containing protein 124-like isoform X1 n=1 Tax=Dermatophagoides pteronyssinus TaxID=6956 RepID=A0A6P6Y6U0_DERPT|nr:coiled-coil domain-containing protein 124-like isoform X1 [Dermatophagoides pteronyssinus]
MPKKLGVNTKAVEAKLRKETAKKTKEELIEKQKEDEYWRDDDKLIGRKMDRQQQRESKKHEQAQRKAQNRAAYEEEMKNIQSISSSSSKPKNITTKKITRSQIQTFVDKKQTLDGGESKVQQQQPTHLEVPLEENINRLQIDGDEARNIDEAINILSEKEAEIDRHPERRMKAAWAAYEQKHLARIKQENPSLRLSQLKEMLRKEFNKSPENPMNQIN